MKIDANRLFDRLRDRYDSLDMCLNCRGFKPDRAHAYSRIKKDKHQLKCKKCGNSYIL